MPGEQFKFEGVRSDRVLIPGEFLSNFTIGYSQTVISGFTQNTEILYEQIVSQTCVVMAPHHTTANHDDTSEVELADTSGAETTPTPDSRARGFLERLDRRSR